MQVTKPKSAVPFIIKNQQKNCYELTKQAQDLLKSIDKNISVVSVAGLYRTGKSYLLNSVILDKKNIFGVGPTVNPCTKGLWLWVQPDPTTEKRSMLIIDTEGLGALDQQANHDMKIFCLAVLLSTTFIYNSVGSIDESALQTLSLVLNLVNNIDQENSSYRPQFVWVVRDFTLQLVDDKGKNLTPQQYLQMALTTNTKQQQKVAIRKTIMNAFTQRDCFTLVKPLIDETKLQNLDKIPMDDLRPEFVSQSIELRNRIKSTLKEFKLTSAKNNITGREYVLVVQKYLNAINTGAVPNMVDTWTFIKEEKCREALEEIRRTYTQKIKSKIVSKIPMRKAALEEYFRSLKQQAKALYLKMTYDESSTEAVQQLFSNAYSQAQKINAQENKQQIKLMLGKQFEPFLKKLFSHYYNSYEEYEAEIYKNFRDILIEKNGDRIDDLRESVEKFADQKLIESFKFFDKKSKEEMKNLKIVKDEMQATLTRQVTQMNQIKQKQRRSQQEKIFDLEKRIRIYENEREQLIEFGKAEKDLIQANLDLLKKKNQELSHTIEEQTKEINNLYTNQNQLKQKHFVQHKQYQKQRALFSQKQQYMNARIRELELKTGELQSKINETGGRLQSQKKTMGKHYQEKVQSLEQENKRLSEKLIEAETKLGKVLDEAKQMSQQIQALKQSSISQKKKLQLKIIQAESNKKPSKIEHDLKQQNQQLTAQNQRLQQKYQDTYKRFKMTEDQMKRIQTNFQKQVAIHVQQIQFLQLEMADMKNRYDELRKTYQNALQNMHDNSKSKQSDLQLKIYELTTEHQKEIKNLETEYEEKVKALKKEIQMLQKHKEEMNLQQSLDKKNLEAKEKEWKESTNMLQAMVKKLEDKLQSSEKDHQDISKEKETFYSIRIKQLEQELEEVREKASNQISENSKKSEQAFAQLKHYSEIEKQQWQKRFIDEKDRAEKKVKSVRDELQKKLNEERQSFEEDISELQSRLAHMERIFNEKLQNMQYDHDIAVQKITNQYMEEKVQLNKQLALVQQKLDFTRQSFEKQMSAKIKYYQTTIQSTKAALRQEFDDNIRKLAEEKESLQQKCQATKKQNRQLQQNNLILKSEVDKQKAVFKQKEKSMEKKIVQMQNRLQTELATYNKTIEAINERHSTQIEKLNEQIDKLNFNVTTLQEERDKLETQHQNNINRLQAKLKVVEQSKNKNKQDYEDIVNKFQCAVSHFGNQKKKILHEKEKGLEEVNEKANECIKQIQEGHRKMLKESQDRIARLVTQNKSLKERLMLIQIEKSTNTNTKKTLYDESEKEKLDKKYQKRIEEYKELYEKEKEKTKKLKDQNSRLRQQIEGSSSFTPTHSNTTYYQRPSFSQISNSRLYNAGSNMLNTTQAKRKFTNTPSVTQRGKGDMEDYSGMIRFNPTTGYKN